jgi:tetratricopeptide (TPR) repeat protein
MRPALADVEAAIRLDDGNPYGFLLKLRILRGSGISDRVTSAFDAAIFKYPGYYPLYEAMLSMLQPKWGGDVPAMYAFVERYAGQADENSPLKLLYLTLYRDLLETASTPCGHYWPDNDKMTQCTASGMQHADMIAYEEAAVALGNKTEQEYYICYGYYQLKDYDNAIRTCTRTIDHATNVLPAHYWRGVAYRDRGDADSALRDLTVVAESQSNFRSSAAIDMSMIHFGRNNNKSALDVLNRYKYLYDPAATGRQNTAVSYNNRCYAYMQLGELNEALDDCTASLKYGAIPDALRKQQELIKRLNVNEKAL